MPRYTVGVNHRGDAVLQRDQSGPMTDFPAYIGGRTVWPGLGDLEDADKNLTEQQRRFKKDMIQAVAKVTAVQVGISVALLFIPVLGWALAALNALVGLIVGDIMKKRLKKVMDRLKTDIQGYQQHAQQEVHAYEEQVTQEVWPDAAALAASGEPLDGLGDFWSSAKDAISKAAKDTVRAVVQFHNAPVKLIGTGVIKGVRSFAHVVHDTKMEKRLQNKEAAWHDEIDRTTQHTTAAMTNLKTAENDARRAVGMVTGEEQIRVAQEKGNLLKQKAYAQIDAGKADALATMQTPEYRAQLVRNLAKAMRGDPSIANDAQYFAAQEAALAAANGLPADAVVPTVKPAGAGGLLAAAAAVGAYFMLR